MSDEKVPAHDYDYADGPVRLAVDAPGDGRVRVHAGGDGWTASFEVSILGAQRLTSMLDTAMSKAITRGFPSNG